MPRNLAFNMAEQRGQRMMTMGEFVEWYAANHDAKLSPSTLRKRLYNKRRSRLYGLTMIGGDYVAPASEWMKLAGWNPRKRT